MGIRSCAISFLPLVLCVLLAAPAAGQQKKQKPENSIESLFEGLPADLRKNVKNNTVRRDRVNDWLKEHVNGKGKTIEVRVPVEIIPRRAKDGAYYVSVRQGGTSGASMKALGEKWQVVLVGPAVTPSKGGKGIGKGGRGGLRPYFRFMGVSAADAEQLADLKEVTIQGKVKEAEILPDPGFGAMISLVLDDVRLDGKKYTPYKPAAEK